MTPQVNLDGTERTAQAPYTTALGPAPTAGRVETPALREPTFAERQGLAMSWVGIALGMFLLLGGLALWAAVALSAGFGGWLIGMAVMGAVIVVVIAAVNYALRPIR
jgi:hypothetical protein